MPLNGKLILSIVVFALCIVPTVVSYAPYSFMWDDSDYLLRSIQVSKAFWSGDTHQLRLAMVSVRPPVMTLLGLPWGPLASWDAAGKCFITLTAFTAFFVSCCLFLLLRIGLQPLHLAIASVCVFAALGPYPTGASAHYWATAFMVDSLFAWTAFAALLLIPYEAVNHAPSTNGSLVRGILWAVIFSVGAITKVSFFYFIVLIIPTLFVVRMRHSGVRSALLSLISLTICSFPVALYWLRFGRPILNYGRAASFGSTSFLYHVSLLQFVGLTIRQSPGMLLSGIFAIAGAAYLIVKRRHVLASTNILPLLIMFGYCAISLASANREIRFLLPGIIGLLFLIGILITERKVLFSPGHAIAAALFVFCCSVAAGVPMSHRANRQSIARGETVVTQAVESNAKHVVLATDSSTLNSPLIKIARETSPTQPSVEIVDLGWRAALGMPIEDDLRDIRESDLVVFQNNRALDSSFTNLRVSQYEQYTRQQFGDVPIRIADDIRIYGKH
jgi:hypothetical protein